MGFGLINALTTGENKSYNTFDALGFAGGGAILFGVPGFFVGNYFFKDDYIITYVER